MEFFADTWRKRRACGRCRRIKVRCEFDNPSTNSCKRCLKAGTECITPRRQGGYGQEAGEYGPYYCTEDSNKRSLEERENYQDSWREQQIKRARRNTIADSYPIIMQAEYETERTVQDPMTPNFTSTVRYNTNNTVESHNKTTVNKLVPPRPLNSNNNNNSITSPPLSPPAITQILSRNGNGNGGEREEFINGEENRTKPISDFDVWRPGELRRSDCVQTAVSYGLITRPEIEHYYNRFVREMSTLLPFGVDAKDDIVEMEREQPLLVLSIVVACAASVGQDPMEHLILFIDRVICERLFILGEPSLEIVRSLVVLCVFCEPKPGTKFSIYMLTGLSCTIGLGLGAPEDTKFLLTSNNISSETARLVRQRLEMFLSVYFCVATVVLGTNKIAMLKVLSDTYSCTDVLFSTGDEVDRLAANTLRLLHIGVEGLQAFKANQFGIIGGALSSTAVKAFLDSYKDRLTAVASNVGLTMIDVQRGKQQQQQDSNNVSGEDKLYNITGTFWSFYSQLMLELNETALNQLLFCKGTPDPDVLTTVARDLAVAAHQIVDRFVNTSPQPITSPNYRYFRPLHALSALVRARMILWSLGARVDFLNVEERFKQVKEACMSKSIISYTGNHTLKLLSQIEKWLELKFRTEEDDTTVLENRQKMLNRAIKQLLIVLRMSKAANTDDVGVQQLCKDDNEKEEDLFSQHYDSGKHQHKADKISMSEIFPTYNKDDNNTPQDKYFLLKEIFAEYISR